MHSTTILIKKLRKPRNIFCTKTNNAKMLYHAARLIHRKWHILQSFIIISLLYYFIVIILSRQQLILTPLTMQWSPRGPGSGPGCSGAGRWSRSGWKPRGAPPCRDWALDRVRVSVDCQYIMLPSYQAQSTGRTCWVSLSYWSDTRIARCLSVSRSWKR